ncbi:MAG TPA: MATE family efflux transporter [Treponemataceae bacterium]|jgi:multidrug efflux pump|nr:MATE family efflux transporter [Spirochaetaceae bacterium]HOS29299.1 MATE family efflux transporter [Treponemataceae bacterium]HQL04522.1 MATE family efflux transporter [Treponemataceae bacterium]
MNSPNEKRIALFETIPVPKAVLTLALPTVMGMMVSVVYNMVDTFFVGQTGDPNQVAAVSLTMPLFLLLMAIGNIFGIGGGAHISRLLGQRKYDEVKKVSSTCLYTASAFGFAAMLFFLIFMPGILKIAGTSGQTYGFAKDYLFYIALGAPLVVLSVALGQIVRSEGAAKESMRGMMAGTIVNIILDPIMILWLKMGVSGAAIATIIGNAVSVLFYLLHMLKSHSLLSLSPKHIEIQSRILAPVFAIGIPVSIGNILMSISNVVLNNFVASYGDTVVAGMGISGRLFTIAIMLFIGIGQGIQPLIGYNFASKNYARMNKTIVFSSAVCVICGIILLTLTMLFREQVVALFIDNDEVVKYGAMIIRAQMLSSPVLGLMFIFLNTFQALGKALPSLILTISRQGFVFIPVLFISNSLFGLQGIIYAQPSADIFSTVLAAVMYLIIFRSIKKLQKPIA